jgi:hypothetical protein
MWKQLAMAALLGASLLACTSGGAPATQENDRVNAPAIDDVVAAYEAVRLRLANDESDGLRAAFDRLETAALDAADKAASSPVSDRLIELAAAAEGFDGADLQSARATFAEASSHLVSAIAADPSLAGGLSIFECPMAEYYPKWIQASAPKANPYMGKKMQTCGLESRWE